MALREFTDAAGRGWQVWDTYPSIDNPSDSSALHRFLESQPPKDGAGKPVSVRERYVHGWLTFSAGRERRRLAPIPANWQSASLDELNEYLDRAEVTADVVRKHIHE